MDEMSTGEALRVLIARALVSEPKALILDEPSAGLDVVARLRFLEMVRSIARQGTTIVLITHHVEEIIPEIDRVIFLKHGRADGDGPKAAMLTSERLGQLFGGPVAVGRHDGYFHVTTNGVSTTTP
jgi:iron complex transport system ATP-binding protein